MFVTQSIDQRIEEALPLIARIQQQENAMKETEIFEAWADRLMEGTWALPDTPEKQSQLIELLSKDLLVGADATNATEQLYDLLGDDELFDQLYELAKRDANADARQVVLDRMQELSADPAVMKVIASLNIDADAAMDPPESTPADLDTEQDKVEEMLGGDAADDLIRDVSIDEPVSDMEEAVKDPRTQTEDPEDTEQPDYPEYQEDLASILKTAGVPAKERPAPDYETAMDEDANPGVTPADIDGVPAEVDEAENLSPFTEGQCNMTEAGTMCEVHGKAECGREEATALQGQYGHSGRMRPVDKDSSFLDRLKELSGMIKN
jgi:uncharacterized protein YrzB (UPF0473 family)